MEQQPPEKVRAADLVNLQPLKQPQSQQLTSRLSENSSEIKEKQLLIIYGFHFGEFLSACCPGCGELCRHSWPLTWSPPPDSVSVDEPCCPEAGRYRVAPFKQTAAHEVEDLAKDWLDLYIPLSKIKYRVWIRLSRIMRNKTQRVR